MTYAFHSEGIRRIEVTVNNRVSVLTTNTSVNVYGAITGLTFTGCCGRAFGTAIHFEASVQTGRVSSYHWTLRNEAGVAISQSEKQTFVYNFGTTGRYQIQITARNPFSNQTVVDHFSVQVSFVKPKINYTSFPVTSP